MKIVTGIILAFLLGAMYVSLFHMSTEMEMVTMGGDCMYMAHEQTLCPMSTIDHLGAWKSLFQSIVPSIILLLTVAGAVLLVSFITKPLHPYRYKPIVQLLKRLQEQTYHFSYRALQEFFARGILHPKLF